MKKYIKFVKRAHLWCLTIIEFVDGKRKQTQQWFSTENEAYKEAENIRL